MTAILDSLPEIEAQLKTLIHNDGTGEDSAGRTPLIALAEALAGLPPDQSPKNMYADACAEITAYILGLRIEVLRSWLSFLYVGRFGPNPIVERIEKLFRTGLRSKDDIPKRAELARWLAMQGRKLCLLYTSPSPRDRTRSRM